MNTNLVWTGTLDSRYVVTVTREAPYRGIFTIKEGEQVLYRESVGLRYNAQFGPDVDDAERWQEIAERFIDGRR